ncbi:HupU protein [Telmatospirillum sp.]|uniref:NADH-quinone oxidoreductase subunit B family protein n=1 Tax=Telmatospirillum sp. TaxID=2079197 RepID=UPI00283E1E8B|nr:HupU protein [Telmatospirillum sp.]MDR3435174.1 HupU protein [Telmatospirillum sp.]
MKSRLSVLWLQAGSCGGCTMSALGAETLGLSETLERADIELLWHPSLAEEGGPEVLRLLEQCRSGERAFDVLCVEGALLTGSNGNGRFQILAGGLRPVSCWVRDLAQRARYVVAVGSCAAFGAIPASPAVPTEAKGLQYTGEEPGGLLGAGWLSGSGLPVINVSGCAPHPGWVVETLMGLGQGILQTADLDSFGRPRFWADHLVHHGCARNEFYEFKASAAAPSQLGCLLENLGCKGTQAPGDCNLRLWNGGWSCPNAGYACINCTSPAFEDPIGAFLETPKVAGVPLGLPVDMPKAWYVALSVLSKSATPDRVRKNACEDHVVVPPHCRSTS